MVTRVGELFTYVSQKMSDGLQGVCYGLDVAKKMHGNLNVVQKTAQIGSAIITLYKPDAYQKDRGYTILWSVSEVINSTRILQDFGNWCFPISADRIDEDAVVKSFYDAYKKHINEEDAEDLLKAVKAAVTEQLKQMKPLRNLETLQEYISIRLNNNEKFKIKSNIAYDLKPSENWLYATSIYSTLANANWVIVNIGSTLNNLIQSNVIPADKLAELADSLGKNKVFNHVFSIVKKLSLDQWIVGFVCTGVLLNLLDAINVLKYDRPEKTIASLNGNQLDTKKVVDEDAIKQAWWNRLTNTADLVYYTTLFANIAKPMKYGQTIVSTLCIVSRGIGVYSIYRNL